MRFQVQKESTAEFASKSNLLRPIDKYTRRVTQHQVLTLNDLIYGEPMAYSADQHLKYITPPPFLLHCCLGSWLAIPSIGYFFTTATIF